MSLPAARLLDDPAVCRHLFYPRPLPFAEPLLIEGEGFTLGCRHRVVDPAWPTVVHFHGNGETVAESMLMLEPLLVALGANVLFAEYRGFGLSTGRPALLAMLDDVELVVRASGLPPRRLVFFGRSIGSLYAVHAAARYPEAAGLVLESGIARPLLDLASDLARAGLPVDAAALEREVAEHLDQQAKLAAFRGRTLVLHTRDDELVPVLHAELLHRWAPEPKALVLFDHGGHNGIFEANARAYLAAVRQLLRSIG